MLSPRREDAKGRRKKVKGKGVFPAKAIRREGKARDFNVKGLLARRRGGAEKRKDDRKLEVKGGCSRQDAKTLREGEGI